MACNNTTIDIHKEYPFQQRAETMYMIAEAMLKEKENHV